MVQTASSCHTVYVQSLILMVLISCSMFEVTYSFNRMRSLVCGSCEGVLKWFVFKLVRAGDHILSVHSTLNNSLKPFSSFTILSFSALIPKPFLIWEHFKSEWPRRKAKENVRKTETSSASI